MLFLVIDWFVYSKLKLFYEEASVKNKNLRKKRAYLHAKNRLQGCQDEETKTAYHIVINTEGEDGLP